MADRPAAPDKPSTTHMKSHRELSPFQNLAPEILLHIFGYLPTPLDIFIHTDPDESSQYRPLLQSVLAIRQVCRIFRDVANDLVFWKDDDLDLSEFIIKKRRPEDRARAEAHFLDVLLTDPGLVNSNTLQQKEGWTFRSYLTLRAVFKRMGRQLSERLRYVVLDWMYYETPNMSVFQAGLATMAPCSNLDYLELLSIGHANFSHIAEYCPQLKELFIHYPRSCYGSLEKLSNLKRLTVKDADPMTIQRSIFFPVQSANSLKCLHFDHMCAPDFWHDIPAYLRLFRKLRKLHIAPMTDTLCAMLLESTFDLREFSTSTPFGGSLPNTEPAQIAWAVTKLLGAKCMRNLKSLTLNFGWSYYLPGYAVLAAIATNLPNLKYLDLHMDIKISWFREFSKMTALKSIYWEVDQIHRSTTHEDPQLGYWNTSDTSGIRPALEAAFAHISPLPKVHLSLEKWSNHPQASFLLEEYEIGIGSIYP